MSTTGEKMLNDLKPIFIMGAPRSGTTLLASMLASREDTIALPEMHFIHKMLGKEAIHGELNRDLIINTLKTHFMFNDLNLGKSESEIEELIGSDLKVTIENILERYNSDNYNKKFQYWVEHSPHNHRYFNSLIYHFPNSKFIHILRDGRAVYRSLKNTDWGYQDVISGAKFWNRNVTSCLILEKVFPEKVFTIKYEYLTENPEACISELCDFIGYKFDEKMLESNGIITPGFSKYQADLGKKPSTSNNTKWAKELSKKEINHFTAHNFDLLNRFGYDVSSYELKEIKGIERILISFFSKIKRVFLRRKAEKRFSI